ncbi:MAG TPA: inorganic phosphate transporter, partial [Saprospiraceae bacterium]|nr:inorganic phosphate transporter [Saprospiraceae bacterium]
MLQQAFVDLSTSHLIFFILAIIGVCAFEFVNGFHDTANAVATVIYTRSLKPVVAVIWSGVWNFLGVWSGIALVATSIISLLPVGDMMGMTEWENITIVFAVIITAITWNLLTWYYGIPCSSSHTLIGSMLGVGMAFFWTHGGNGINWNKAKDIGMALLVSPALGFSLVILILFFLKYVIRNKEIFKDPAQNENRPPVWWVRGILLITCTMVSFFHGKNDGQKGIGILMIVFLVMLPGYYALNPNMNMDRLKEAVHKMKDASMEYQQNPEHTMYAKPLGVLDNLVQDFDSLDPNNKEQKLQIRKNIQTFSKSAKAMLDDPEFLKDDAKRKEFKKALHTLSLGSDYTPVEAMLLISLSLGFGTMVGWKRIVITIGEKIGKSHLTYAQGAAAELAAATTIASASSLGLPVSTTHVLSSGVAGSMVGMGGVKNLQRSTVAAIASAWVLTLPVTFLGAMLL